MINRVTTLTSFLFVGMYINLSFSQIMIDPAKPDFVFSGGKVVSQDFEIDFSQLMTVDGVKQHLELSKNQEGSIADQIHQMGIINFEISQKIAKEPDVQRLQEAWELIQANQKKLNLFVENVLLPHQLETARHLAVREYLFNVDWEVLISETFSKSIANLSDQDRESFQARAREIEKELKEKIVVLKFEALQKIVSELPPDSRQKLDFLLKLDPEKVKELK